MDPDTLRASMPALEGGVYLNTGASGPSPEPVVESVTDFLTYHEFESPTAEGMYPAAWDELAAVRETVARFVGAGPREIALTRSTADGINLLAAALDLGPDDVVVRTDLEHSAGWLPWERLADSRGVTVRVLETESGRLSMDSLKDAVADATLVTLSSITWSHGTRLPVETVVDVAHDAGAKVLVDAVQSPGQVPVDVKSWGADFVAGAGHKWLLGIWGGGFLYVSDDAIDALSFERIGYRSVSEMDDPEYTYHEGARRLEVGTTSPLPYVGLATAIETIESVGLGTVQDRIERLTDRLKDGVEEDRLLSPRGYESGLVTIDVADPEATVERLQERGVFVRSLPFPDAVRASVHAFNTAEDIDALLDGL